MKGQGIHHPFWCNSRMKASASDQISDMYVEKDKYRQDRQEVKTDEGLQTSMSRSQVSTPSASTQSDDGTKRQRLHSTDGPLASKTTMPPIPKPLFQSVKDIGRVWQFRGTTGMRHRRKSVQFTIVSYNVLADSLLQSHPTLYDDCEEWVLHWEYRKNNLLKEILFYDADILCLQEVQETHYNDWFLPELSRAGYQGLYKKRTGKKDDGCAVFYRSSKFTLLEHCYVNYKMDHVPIMDRDNIAILALLHPKFNDGRTCHKTALCIANTHLLFNRNRGDIKLLQLASLFAEIDKLKREFLGNKNPKTSVQRIPVVLCGDFNMTPSCDLYKYITRGYLDYRHLNKKDLSGQNSVVRHGNYVSGRDCLRENIIPKEMGLTNMSTWDLAETSTSDQTVNPSNSAIHVNDNDWPSLSDASSKSFTLPVQEETVSQLHAQACSSRQHGGIHNDQELPKPVQFDTSSTVIRHRLFFESVYKHFFRDNVCEVTTYHEKEPSCTVDYFFASPGRDTWCRVCKARHSVMELTGSLSLLSEEDVSILGGLPSKTLSSDHLALVASFALHL